MDLSSILLTIIHRMNGERSSTAAFHLLRGKKSGQTLQDVEIYQVKRYFSILPTLHKNVYDQAIASLLDKRDIEVNTEGLVLLTSEGLAKALQMPEYRFKGWDYRGNEKIFFSRLSLIVQTLSFFRHGEKSFIPIEKDFEIQAFVKNFLHKLSLDDPLTSIRIGSELQKCLHKSGLSENQKNIITYRLGGYGQVGWTWHQLSERLQVSVPSLQLQFIEALHQLLETIELVNDAPLMKEIASDIKVESYLTSSSVKTKELFQKGYSVEEIASIRNLKNSTIEDHLVEISTVDSQFPFDQFVSQSDRRLVLNKIDELGTKRLKLLKDEFDQLSYFQIRLILGSRGDV